MTRGRLIAGVCVLGLTLAACGGGGDTSPQQASPTPAPAASNDVQPAEAPALLQFSAPLVGGGEIDATTLSGKPTVFWFWAPT